MKKSLLSLAAVLLLLSACSGKTVHTPPTESPSVSGPSASVPPAPTPTPTPTSAPAAAPVWGTTQVKRDFHAQDGTVVLTVNFSLPKVTNPEECPAGSAINAWYDKELNARLAEAEAAAQEASADYEVSSSSGLPFSPVTQEMSFLLTRFDDTVISVCREWYINFGGPTPAVFRLSEQFDPASGAKLSSVDFFSDPAGLSTAVISAMETRYPKTRGQLNTIFQPEDFYFTDQGCTFWVQGGALAGINAPLEITLPYKDLEVWMHHG